MPGTICRSSAIRTYLVNMYGSIMHTAAAISFISPYPY